MAPDKKNQNIEFKKVIDNIDIPPHPEVLSSFLDEQKKPEPDLKEIGNLLSRDVAISAGILKTVNSSFPQNSVAILLDYRKIKNR